MGEIVSEVFEYFTKEKSYVAVSQKYVGSMTLHYTCYVEFAYVHFIHLFPKGQYSIFPLLATRRPKPKEDQECVV